MSIRARAAVTGAALSAAVVATLATVSPPSLAGSVAEARERSDLWHERSDRNAPGAALPAGFSPLPSLAPLIKTLKPAVVSVSTTSVVRSRYGQRGGPADDFFRNFFGDSGPGGGDRVMPRSTGSGFVIHQSGLVLTNNHVIDGADQIDVKLADGREFKADVVGRDPKTDVALLRIRNGRDLPHVVLGDSDGLEVGDWVVAIGNPFGLAHSVSVGIVSAKERFIGAGPYDDFIQTDAAINPGNSGGPLFNARGEVIGMNTAIVAQGQGIGFAVPVNLIKALVPQLERGGRVSRGWLGVAIQDMTPELARSLRLDRVRGALVAEVVEGSPAESAGLRPGDVVMSLEGRPIDSYNQLTRSIALLAPGSRVQLGVLRDGRENALSVTVGERDEATGLARSPSSGGGGRSPKVELSSALGLAVGELTAELARAAGVRPGEGVVVREVRDGSPAALAGVSPGDVILEVNRRRIRSVGEFTDAARKVQADDLLLLRIQRGGSAVYVAVRAS